MNEATLKPSEPHPMAHDALDYVKKHLTSNHKEALASCAVEGNRVGEICLSTIRRIEESKPVSDRYILGLAWCIKQLDENLTSVGGV